MAKGNKVGVGAALVLLSAPFSVQGAELSGCAFGGIELKGKVEIVDSFPDIKVEIVDSFPDLRVEMVSSFPDDCGQWQIVGSFGDFKVQYVDSFPDIKIQLVDSFPGLP